MEPMESQARLEATMAELGVTTSDLTSSAAVDLMLGFYVDQRASGVVGLDEDGDMLLVEWGVYDWGDGPSFQFGFTRQFIHEEGDGDDAITQLQLVLHYDASPPASDLGRGHRWCHRPEEIDAFRVFIESSSAAAYARDATPIRVEVAYEPV